MRSRRGERWIAFWLAGLSASCGRVGYDVWRDTGLTSEAGGASSTTVDSGRGGVSSLTDAGSAGGVSASGGGASGAGGAAASGGSSAAGGALAGAAGNGNGGTAVDSGGATGAGGIVDASIGNGGTAGSGGATGSAGAGAADASTGSGGSTADGSSCVITNGGVETCDGLDNDCNGTPDDGAICGAACTGATYGGHAYAFCSTLLAFADAETDCVSKAMRLARIDDAAENQFIATIAFAAYASSYNTAGIWPWFGAYDSASPVQWQFIDGTVFWTGKASGSSVGGLYSNWGPANPGDATGTRCATLNHATGFAWIDRVCTELRAYVCEAY